MKLLTTIALTLALVSICYASFPLSDDNIEQPQAYADEEADTTEADVSNAHDQMLEEQQR